MQLHKLIETKFSNQVAVKLITIEPHSRALEYKRTMKCNWPILIDEARKSFRAFGMKRASAWTLYNPISCVRYLKTMINTRPGKPGRDLNQLGGNILIDGDGIIRLHHVSTHPHDRPSMPTIDGLITKWL